MSGGGHLRQLASETVIYGLSGTVGRLVGVFLIPLYTRVFSPSDYGVISLLSTVALLATTVTVLGLDGASARWFYDSQEESYRRRVLSSWFWCQLVVSLACGLVVLAVAVPFAEGLLDTRARVGLVVLTAATIPLSAFDKILGNYLRFTRKAWTAAIYATLNSLVTIGIIALFVLVWRGGLPGYFTAQVLAAGLAGIAAVAILWPWVGRQDFDWRLLRQMLAYGLPLVPAGLAGWITQGSDRVIMKIFTDAGEVGLFSIANSLAAGVALVTQAFILAWSPFALSILSEEGHKRVYADVLTAYAVLTCWLCTGLALFAPAILWVFATPKFYGAATSVSYLAFAYAATGCLYIASIGSHAAKRSGPIALSTFVAAGFSLALNFALIPSMGRDGAALATMISCIVSAAYLFYASQKLYPIPYRFGAVALCMGLAWVLIEADHFLVKGGGWGALAAKSAIALAFLPMMVPLGIVRWGEVMRASAWVRSALKTSPPKTSAL